MVCYICAYLHEHFWGLRISSRRLPHFPTLVFEIGLSLNLEFPGFGRLAGLSPGVHLSLNPQCCDCRVTDPTSTPDFYVNECWGSQELMLTHRVISPFLYSLAMMKSDKWQVWAPIVDNGHVISLLNGFCSFLCERKQMLLSSEPTVMNAELTNMKTGSTQFRTQGTGANYLPGWNYQPGENAWWDFSEVREFLNPQRPSPLVIFHLHSSHILDILPTQSEEVLSSGI